MRNTFVFLFPIPPLIEQPAISSTLLCIREPGMKITFTCDNATTAIYGSSVVLISTFSYVISVQCDVWFNWDSTQDFTVTSLPGIMVSIGGLWLAFRGVLTAVFGTSITFSIFGHGITT